MGSNFIILICSFLDSVQCELICQANDKKSGVFFLFVFVFLPYQSHERIFESIFSTILFNVIYFSKNIVEGDIGSL